MMLESTQSDQNYQRPLEATNKKHEFVQNVVSLLVPTDLWNDTVEMSCDEVHISFVPVVRAQIERSPCTQ